MMEKHNGDRIGGSPDFKLSTLFGIHEYIATDYNKKSDIHKAHLEDERNLNASFSRKPFKTQSYTHQAPTETYYFNIKKKIKAGNNISSSNLDDVDSHLLERTHGTLPAPNPRADSKLRKLKRNVYSTDEKEKILKGHLYGQRGRENILSTGDRKQTKKSTATLKEWSTRIFVDLAENWPNLHFQIEVKDIDCDDGDGTVTAPLHSALNSSSLFDTHTPNIRGVKSQGQKGETEELLIQFDTDIQILPPEKALSRYMAHLASHGSAAEFGLQRNCDRWGILEKGYIETPFPVRKSHEVMLRVVEFPVKRIETSYNVITEKNQTGSMNEINLQSNNISGSSSPYRQDKGISIINRSQSDDTYVRDSSVLPVPLKLTDKWDPQRDITTGEIEDRAALRVLLYRAFDLTEDFSKHITEAITKVRGEFPSLGSYDRQDMLDRESTSARLPQSARSNNGMKESARGLLGRNGDSARGGFGVPTMHTVLLTNSVKVVCVVTDAIPEGSSSAIPTVTSYDINGRPYMHSIGHPEIACHNLSSTSANIATHQEFNKSGFTHNYEEGSSALELFESLGKSFTASFKSPSSLDGIQVGHSGQGGNRIRKEFRIVVTVTGKWASAANPASSKDLATSPISTRNYQSPCTPLSPHVTVQPIRNTEVASDLFPISYEHKKRSNDSFDVSCSEVNVPTPDLFPARLISLRTLLKSSKNFTYIEQGKNNLHSHKEKLKEKARLNIKASEELKKLDYRSTSSSAVRKKVEIVFSLTDLIDTVQLTERLISCVAKAAGLLPYHLIEGPKIRRGSMKGGDPVPAATGLSVYDGNQHDTTVIVPSSITRSLSNPISRPFDGNPKTAVRLEEDIGRIGVEDVPNGMREANLLTFAFYAPWVKCSQLNASKKEANSIRQKTRLLQEQERVEKVLWRRRAEMLLFGTPVDPRISDLTLQAGGGLIGMKWLISNIDMDMEKDMEGDPDQDRGEYTDILSDMAPTMSPYVSIGRKSFNNNNSHTDRSIGTGRRTSNHRKSNSMSSIPSNTSLNQSRDTSTVPISFPITIGSGSAAASEQGLNINVGRDRDNDKRKGISAKSGLGGLSSRSHRTDSLAHVLGIRGNNDRDFFDDVGAHCEAKTLRGQDLVSEVYSLSSQSDRSMDNRTMGARKLEMYKVLSKRRLSKGLLIDTDLVRETGQGSGRGGLTATEKEILAEIRDKLEDSDYQSAFQILKRNPLTQLGKEDARSLLNNLDSLTAVSADFEKNQQQTVDACTFLYKRLERQSVLKGFGCVDGEYPEKSSDITPTKLEQITGISIAALTPMQRTTYWRLAGIGFCLAEYAFGKSVGIDPLLTLIPATLAIFSIDQLFYRGSGFETVYQKIFPEYKKKIIYHEAGHFLLAYLLGIPVRGCVTNAWEARKYPDIKGQAGTIFYDPKLADELLNQKITRSSLDRMSVVIMAGIAAEAIRFGKAEGGAADEQSLVGFLTSIQPPWNILRIQGQARWAAMQAILLIREHEKAYDALCIALEEGKSVGDAILAIEENLPTVLPSLQRIDDRKNRKKTMESDLLMRYIQKVTWKVGGIEAAEYEGNVILGENPHEKASGVLGGGGKVSETAAVDDYIETLAECLGDITERMDVLKSNSNDGQALPPLDTLQTQIKKKQDLRKDINKQSAIVGMDGYIVGAVSVNKKSLGGSRNDINDTVDDDDSEMEQDEAVKAFKQKIKRLEKAAKAGQLNVGEKSDDGGVWLNNLESLDLKQPNPPVVEVEKSKVVFPGLGFTNNGEITIPPPLEGYEERIEEMIKRDLKAQEDLLVTPNEDNVLKQIISVVDLSKIDSTEGPSSTSSVTSSSGIWLSQSKGRDAVSENSSSSSEFKESQTLPREMLLTRRGYQVKKLENSRAGFTKKVSDVDARIAELKEALTKREVASSSTVRR